MNKRTLKFLAAALATLVIVGYPAGAWFVGKQVEAKLGDEYKQLHDYAPFLSLKNRSYQRGVFSSAESATFTVALPSGEAPLTFTVTSRIRHLPFPGFFALEAAAIESDITIEGEAAAGIAEWTGGKQPATVHTAAYFNGGGRAILTIPALNSAKLSSDEATVTMDFSRDLESYALQGTLPRVVILEEAGGKVQISGVRVNSDHKRILPDLRSLYSGTDHFAVDQIEISSPQMPSVGLVKQLALDIVATASSDSQFVDIAENIGAGSLNILGADYGPAQLDLSFRHLHARSVARLSEVNWAAPGENPDATLKDVEALFLHQPEFRVDRLSFNRPDGETLVSALFKLRDVQAGDLDNPQAWASRVYASVDVKMPEQLLSDLAQNMFGDAFLREAGFGSDLASMVAGGYLTRENGFVKTRFEFHDAKRWFNGKEMAEPAAGRSAPHHKSR